MKWHCADVKNSVSLAQNCPTHLPQLTNYLEVIEWPIAELPRPLDVCTMPMYMLLQPPTTVDVCTWNVILCWRRQTGCAPKCRRSQPDPSKSRDHLAEHEMCVLVTERVALTVWSGDRDQTDEVGQSVGTVFGRRSTAPAVRATLRRGDQAADVRNRVRRHSARRPASFSMRSGVWAFSACQTPGRALVVCQTTECWCLL